MRTQIRNEAEELKKYGRVLNDKEFHYWRTIDRRDTLRALRFTLYKFDIHLSLPFNYVGVTDLYCRDFGDASIEKIQSAPKGWKGPPETDDFIRDMK